LAALIKFTALGIASGLAICSFTPLYGQYDLGHPGGYAGGYSGGHSMGGTHMGRGIRGSGYSYGGFGGGYGIGIGGYSGFGGRSGFGVNSGFGGYSGFGVNSGFGGYGPNYGYGSNYGYGGSRLGYSGLGYSNLGYSNSYFARPSINYSRLYSSGYASPHYLTPYASGYNVQMAPSINVPVRNSNVYSGPMSSDGQPTGDLRPGMVLPDGAVVVSVGSRSQ